MKIIEKWCIGTVPCNWLLVSSVCTFTKQQQQQLQNIYHTLPFLSMYAGSLCIVATIIIIISAAGRLRCSVGIIYCFFLCVFWFTDNSSNATSDELLLSFQKQFLFFVQLQNARQIYNYADEHLCVLAARLDGVCLREKIIKIEATVCGCGWPSSVFIHLHWVLCFVFLRREKNRFFFEFFELLFPIAMLEIPLFTPLNLKMNSGSRWCFKFNIEIGWEIYLNSFPFDGFGSTVVRS